MYGNDESTKTISSPEYAAAEKAAIGRLDTRNPNVLTGCIVELEDAIGILSDALGAFENKLEPITRVYPESTQKETDADRPAVSRLTERVLLATYQVNAIRHRIDKLLESVEV